LSTAARYAQQVLKLRGVQEVRLVPENPDAADFATAVTAATAGSPDAVLVGFPGQACARIMTTARALGVKSPFFYGSVCADDAVLKAAGKAADGARFAIGYRVYDDKADTEVAAYRRALDTYASGTKSYSVASEAGFSTVVNTAATLRDVGDPTASALLTALQATRDRPNFMGHPYTCDRKQVPLLGSVCNPWVRIVEYRDGGYAEVAGDWVSGAQLASGLGG
jgi:branched-chain amino acid transport system substrate-binding protein